MSGISDRAGGCNHIDLTSESGIGPCCSIVSRSPYPIDRPCKNGCPGYCDSVNIRIDLTSGCGPGCPIVGRPEYATAGSCGKESGTAYRKCLDVRRKEEIP